MGIDGAKGCMPCRGSFTDLREGSNDEANTTIAGNGLGLALVCLGSSFAFANDENGGVKSETELRRLILLP